MREQLIAESIKLLNDPTRKNICLAITYLNTVLDIEAANLRELEQKARELKAKNGAQL